MKISGEFDVTLEPLNSHATGSAGVRFARMSIQKTFHGDLSAVSSGEMLSARTPVEGAAAYVAIEQVHGHLDGKAGSFLLQHFGTMGPDHHRLVLEVVPHSATGELTGLAGAMMIRVDEGKHLYDFDFELTEECAA